MHKFLLKILHEKVDMPGGHLKVKHETLNLLRIKRKWRKHKSVQSHPFLQVLIAT